MYITRIQLKNWKNFSEVDVPLTGRVFIVGPNAVGKSNFLDAFRFLRDIAMPDGGLQRAVNVRGGITKIRNLNARQDPEIQICVELSDKVGESPIWKYAIGLRQETRGERRPYLTFEKIWQGEVLLLDRAMGKENETISTLSQTWLEQSSQNEKYKPLRKELQEIMYYHLVPQLLRYPMVYGSKDQEHDPFGQGFLKKINQTPKKTQKHRLNVINDLLSKAVPQIKDLTVEPDDGGKPHLHARYEHWRPNAGKQDETDFSDGTLRLIALLWTIMENKGILLLEEPELSLHNAIVSRLPFLFAQSQKSKKVKRQYIVTSHSETLLSDESISMNDVLRFVPTPKGTVCQVLSQNEQCMEEHKNGVPIAEMVESVTAPPQIRQLRIPGLE